MKNKKAFTLVEVLISLFISSFIILGMLQLYRNVQNFIDKTYSTMKINRKVYVLFSQLQKDLSFSFIPESHSIEESKKLESNKDEKDQKENYFKGEIVEGEYKGIKGKVKRLELFKSLNFISTNSLHVYEENNVYFLRIGYFLEKNKELSQSDRYVYNLYRKETRNISNQKFQQDTSSKKEDKIEVKKFLIAQNIKHFSVEYYGFKKEDKKADNKFYEKNNKKKLFNSFVWGDKKETENILPKKILFNISFWNDKFIGEYSFNCVVKTYVVAIGYDQKQENKNKLEVNKENKKTEQGESDKKNSD